MAYRVVLVVAIYKQSRAKSDRLATGFHQYREYSPVFFDMAVARSTESYRYYRIQYFTFLQPSLIKAAGYPAERHRVSTPDGYELQLHRIPAGRRIARRTAEPTAKGKKAILIMHGLLGDSGNFVIMGPERSLGKNNFTSSFIQSVRDVFFMFFERILTSDKNEKKPSKAVSKI